ncbi:hypothetical protein F5X99DRAFT_393315 [Biscogniauxia marginata]|nr:hypothetical protein F5X99DRAFT_393315 [Biscogniauxia marginata]
MRNYYAAILQDGAIDTRFSLWFTSSRFGLWEDLYCYPQLFRELVTQLSTTNTSLMREIFNEHTFAISILSAIHMVSSRRFRAAAKECERRLNEGEAFTLKTLLVKAFPRQEAVREGPRPARGTRSMAESLIPRVREFKAGEPKPKTAGCYVFRLVATRGTRVRYVVLRDASDIIRQFGRTKNGPKARITTTVCMSSGSKKGECCSICLEDEDDGTGFVWLPCGHYFHWCCAKMWLDTRKKANCPLCRLPVNYASFANRG